MTGTQVVNYRWHDNRHTFCSRLAMRGENLKVIQQFAGHKTIQMSARFAHLGEKSHFTLLSANSDVALTSQRSTSQNQHAHLVKLLRPFC
jgi:site-specific recombinase XerD